LSHVGESYDIFTGKPRTSSVQFMDAVCNLSRFMAQANKILNTLLLFALSHILPTWKRTVGTSST
jgi:hypothetical protein